MKKLNVTLIWKAVGNTSLMVPDELSLEEAIEYAKNHLDEISLPRDGEYIGDSDELDEENCNFKTDDDDDNDGDDDDGNYSGEFEGERYYNEQD